MSDTITIIQIGKDEALASIMAEQASLAGFGFKEAASIAEADRQADIWLLAPGVEMDAQEAGPMCIMITDKQHPASPQGALVFEKPIRLAQLLDTALSSARLARKKQPRALTGDSVFYPFTRSVTGAGQDVTLTEKEASLLCAILDAGDAGLPRAQAMTQLWGYHPDVESHAVDTTLYRLRQKLQDIGDMETHLLNEGGIYKWKGA